MPVAEVDTEPFVVVEGDVAAIPFPQAEQNNNEPEAELARDLGLVMLKEDRPEHFREVGRQHYFAFQKTQLYTNLHTALLEGRQDISREVIIKSQFAADEETCLKNKTKAVKTN